VTEPAAVIEPIPTPTPAPTPEPTPTPEPAPEPTPTPTPTEFKWNEGWRAEIAARLAGDNKDLIPKYQKQLEQHLDPVSLFKQNVELRKKMDSGELKKPLSDKPTPEELAAYRKSNGIPETPDKYDIKPDGVWAEEDNKEGFNGILKLAHDNHYTPKQAKALVDHMAKGYQGAIDALAERDASEKSETEEVLRKDFGPDYKPNMNLMSGLFDGEEQGFKDDLFNARLADGTKLINDPAFNKLMVRLAREINPAAAIMPSGSTDTKSIEDEIKTLSALQATDENKFWSKPIQDRLIELRGARDKMKQKAA
jgi:hypothetical protein